MYQNIEHDFITTELKLNSFFSKINKFPVDTIKLNQNLGFKFHI